MKTCIRDGCGMPFSPQRPEKRDLSILRAFWWRYCPKHRMSPEPDDFKFEPQTIVERVDAILHKGETK